MQLTNTEFIQSYFSVQKTFGMQKMRSNIRDISIILGFLSETSKVWIVNYVSYKFRKLCIKLVGVWRLRMKVSHFLGYIITVNFVIILNLISKLEIITKDT